MRRFRSLNIWIKNQSYGNIRLVLWCAIFSYIVLWVLPGAMVERFNVVATVVIALAALHLQSLSSKKDRSDDKEERILNYCKLIKNSFIDTRSPDDEGNVKFTRVDEKGIKAINEEKYPIYFEVDFIFNTLTNECALYVTIRNLKSDNYEDYYEPFKCIHYISTNTTNGVEILNVRKSDSYVEETEGNISLEPLLISEIGNYEWKEITAVLANILTSYAMKRE